MIRDGLCHELVMMYVHHLTESARGELKSGTFVLPRLPVGEMHHPQNGNVGAHDEYSKRVSCTICHVGADEKPLVV